MNLSHVETKLIIRRDKKTFRNDSKNTFSTEKRKKKRTH